LICRHCLNGQITAGELGTTPAELEESLSRIFQLASQWHALLLLDEADIFLQRRSLEDIARNRFVGVFLRKLEYCETIMFFTTNRVSEFDPAIISRMHLMLEFKEIDPKGRKGLWSDHLKNARTAHGPPNINAKDLDDLAKEKLNGRQVSLLDSF
jgi:hypothetical protein